MMRDTALPFAVGSRKSTRYASSAVVWEVPHKEKEKRERKGNHPSKILCGPTYLVVETFFSAGTWIELGPTELTSGDWSAVVWRSLVMLPSAPRDPSVGA